MVRLSLGAIPKGGGMMMQNIQFSSKVHLVGSIPLGSADEVFELVGKKLAGCCSRIPDGETNERSNWIGWQLGVFEDQGAFIKRKAKEREYQLHPPYTFAPGCSAKDLYFSDLGFAREAITSFSRFSQQKSKGVLPKNAKFMVAIPTPFAPVYSFVCYDDQAAVLPVYEAAILRELVEITKMIPHESLVIQWDVATEMSIFEKVYDVRIESEWEFLMRLLVSLGDKVPADVELGYHLCYGSMNSKHWKEPETLGLCVDVSNVLANKVSRLINFIHMPVPVDRTDTCYYNPLRKLTVSNETQIILGLVHDGQTDEKNINRINIAQKFLPEFGIATECGLGRREAHTIPDLLALHNRLAKYID